MATIRSLSDRIAKLESQRGRHGEFRIVEEFFSEGQFNGACDYVLRRNGMAVFRFPRKLTISEWESKHSQPHP